MANPPPDFVDIPFTPDANAMADGAVEVLRGMWPDWEPADADPEIILIEACAPLAADAESMAAQMPAEAIIAIGQNLYGIPYDPGTPAQTTVTLGFVDGTGYTVDAGLQVNIDGYAFNLNDDATIAPAEEGDSGPFELTGVAVSSAVFASAANELTGNVSVSLNLPPSVTTVTVETPTHDGTDPMDDPTYVNLVIAKIRLRADSLITAGDFALEATLQPGVGFAWAQGNTARHITVVLADPSALPLPDGVVAQVGSIFSDPSVRSVNVTYELLPPTYTNVGVAYEVIAAPGQDVTAVKTTIDQMITQVLSPLSAVKNSDPYIRVNRLIALIGGLQQVSYVKTCVLSTTTDGATVEESGDLLMAGGIASLPIVGTIDGTVDVYSP